MAFYLPWHEKWRFNGPVWNGTTSYRCKKTLKTNISIHMGVSENNGTPKSSILIGFSIINHPFWGTMVPLFSETSTYPPLKIAGWKTIFLLIPGRLFDFMSIFQCVLFAPQLHQAYVLRCISPIEETPVMWTAQAVVLKMLGEFRAVLRLVMSIHFRCLDDHFSLLHIQVGCYIDTYYIDVSYYVLFFQLFYLCILFRVNKWRVIPYLYSSVSENISLSCACIFMSFVLLSFLWCGLACIMVQVWLHPWKLTWTLEKSPFVNREIHLQNVGFSIVMSSFGGWIFNLFWRYDGRRKKSSKLRACNYTSNTHLELQDVSTVFGSFLFGGGIWVNSFPNSLKQI